MDNTLVIVLAIALVAALGVAMWLYMKQQRSKTLQNRFGPEYDRTLSEQGGTREAERELQHRAERVEQLHIRQLDHDERAAFAARWQAAQAQFVDDPADATQEADALVGEVMATRGYPVGDFEQRAADVSVNHPRVVEHYRAAHTIALRNVRGDQDGDTEELRQALVHYRALFEDLLGEDASPDGPSAQHTRAERAEHLEARR
jgi:FtsZ-interacting cell division protein ZipA